MKVDNKQRLFEAAVEGDKETLLKLISKRKVDPDIVDSKGMTPLHHAALHGHLDVVNSLILLGADPNIKNKMGKTPLDLAEKNKHEDIAKLLVKNGAKKSLMKNSKEFIDSWKDRGENLGNSRLNKLLLNYIKNGEDSRGINTLVFENWKLDINHIDEKGKTPLDHANALPKKVTNKDNIINTLKLHGAVTGKEAKSLQMEKLSKTFKRESNLKLRIEESTEIEPTESKKDKVKHNKKKSQDARDKLL